MTGDDHVCCPRQELNTFLERPCFYSMHIWYLCCFFCRMSSSQNQSHGMAGTTWLWDGDNLLTPDRPPGRTDTRRSDTSRQRPRSYTTEGFIARTVNSREGRAVDEEEDDLINFDTSPGDSVTLVADPRPAGKCCESTCMNQCAYILQPVSRCAQHYRGECSGQRTQLPTMASVATQTSLVEQQDIVFPPAMTTRTRSTEPPTTPETPETEPFDIVFPPSMPLKQGPSRPRQSGHTSLPLPTPRDHHRTTKPGQDSTLGGTSPKKCRSRDCSFFGLSENGGYCSEHLKLYTIADARGMLTSPSSHHTPTSCHGARHVEDPGPPRESIYEPMDTHNVYPQPSYTQTPCHQQPHPEPSHHHYMECHHGPIETPCCHQKEMTPATNDQTPYQGYATAMHNHNHTCSTTHVTPKPSNPQTFEGIPSAFKQTYESTLRQMSGGHRCVTPRCKNFGNERNHGLCNSCFRNM